MRTQTSQPEVEHCDSEESSGRKDRCVLIHTEVTAEAKGAEKSHPGADHIMSRLDTKFKKMLTTCRGPPARAVREADNQERQEHGKGEQMVNHIFLGLSQCEKYLGMQQKGLGNNREKNPTYSLFSKSYFLGAGGRWKVG